MRFGPLPLPEALGAILAHSQGEAGLKKGRVLTAGISRCWPALA